MNIYLASTLRFASDNRTRIAKFKTETQNSKQNHKTVKQNRETQNKITKLKTETQNRETESRNPEQNHKTQNGNTISKMETRNSRITENIKKTVTQHSGLARLLRQTRVITKVKPPAQRRTWLLW